MIRLTHRLFGTHPIVAHCPGPVDAYVGWQTFVEAALGTATEPNPPRESFTLLTWHGPDRSYKPNGLMERSAARFGCPVNVVGGSKESWVNRDKLRLTAATLQDVTTEYVIGLDSSDVVLLEHPDEMVRRFRRDFACDLLFNATGSECWPPLPEFIMYESSLPHARRTQGRCWLNAGCWVGRTSFCREYFADLAKAAPVAGFECSDQAICKRAWPRWYPRVQIDDFCQIFAWFNESRDVLQVERPRADRQRQLIIWLGELRKLEFGVEVGVFDGGTSDALLQAFPDLRLWMIDPWKPFEGKAAISSLDQQAFEKTRLQALWWTAHAVSRRHILRHDSLTAAGQFPNGKLDFAFIDANHLYESVRSDLHAWWDKVRPGGLLCGHDYGVYGDATGAWGVKRAVDEFAAQQNRPLRLGLDGMWSLRR